MIGQAAPDWSATAYCDGDELSMSNKDFAGKWYVMYFYPLDFTFICPTEIVGFEALKFDFEEESTEIIGVSTDSFFSHQRWFCDRSTFPQPITHPVLADTAHEVSKAFGVLKADQGVAFRATVIVDDHGVVRSVSVNDLSAGRSPDEVLRTVQALQSGGLCPANWRKGEKFAA